MGKRKEISIEELFNIFKNFKEVHGKIPTSIDCNTKGNALPNWKKVKSVLDENNIELNDFYLKLGKISNLRSNPNNYDTMVELYKTINNKNGYPLKYNQLINNPYGLPDARWFVIHCPNKNITNFSQFIEWCGLIPRYEISKEKAIQVILHKQKELNRPLIQSDFAKISNDCIALNTIKNIWGNFNNMKEELGLEIKQNDMRLKIRDINEIETDIKTLCENIYNNESRKTIMVDDFKKHNLPLNYQTYSKNIKQHLNISIRQYIKNIGFDLLKSGSGLVYIYSDGEITSSQFEYFFSNYLRENKFVFDLNYKRSVKYKTFIDNYKGLMDCDYVIDYKGRKIYIEIAGILRDYKEWYINDKPLNSKSKEKYRIKLKEKENMMKTQGLEYYILFPEDLNEDTYNKIFNSK